MRIFCAQTARTLAIHYLLVFTLIMEAKMVFFVSDEVRRKSGGPRMIVTGYASGMVECRWYDGFCVQREAFHEDELIAGGMD